MADGRQSSRDFYRQRIAAMNPQNPLVARASELLDKGLDAWGGAADRVAAVSNDPQWRMLNEQGQRAKRQESLAEPFRTTAKSKAALKRLQKTLQETAPRLPAVDKGDLVGAMLDQERRALIRQMTPDQRERLLTSGTSPELLSAVVRAEPELSGVTASQHQALKMQLLESGKPQEVKNFREAAEALEVVASALNETDRALREEGAFAHETEFKFFYDRHVKPTLEKETPAPVENPNDVEAWVREARRKAGVAA
jgi:hypothetical protein